MRRPGWSSLRWRVEMRRPGWSSLRWWRETRQDACIDPFLSLDKEVGVGACGSMPFFGEFES